MKQEFLTVASLGLALSSIAFIAYEKFYEPRQDRILIESLQKRLQASEKMIRANTYVDCLRERVYLHPNVDLNDCYNVRVKIAVNLEK